MDEIPLFGGDVSDGVVRVGDTVRRTPASGAAAQGREIVTFIEGEMGGRPLHPWAASEAALARIAEIQRRLHDVPVSIELPPDAEVIGHNDITFENTIFVDGLPVGIVDFDLAGPTTRLLDVATTLRYWAPLSAPEDRDLALRSADAARRARVFADAYGLDDDERHDLLDVADRRFTRSWEMMKHRAEHDGGGWARMWNDGAGDHIKRSHAWFKVHRDEFAGALHR